MRHNIVEATLKIKYIGWLFRFCYLILYNKADFIFLSSNSKQILEGLISVGVKKEKIKLVPNVIDDKNIKKGKTEIYKPIRFSKNPNLPQLISIGRLVKQKGMDKLISWFSQMNEKADLLIIGEGFKKNLLKKQIKDLKLKDRVIFLVI